MRRTRITIGISKRYLLIGSCLSLGACSTVPQQASQQPAPVISSSKPSSPSYPQLPSAGSGRGGYYQDDGPGSSPPPDLASIPDAVPKAEPLLAKANKPYTVFGQTYTPETSIQSYKEEGIASWYGRKFHGQKTSSGEPYNMYAMTAAHCTLPIPSYARVTNPKNGKSVIVRINDRGPFHSDRLIDLSYTAAYKLGIVQNGSGQVIVESIDPDNYAPSQPVIAVNEADPAPANPPAPDKIIPAEIKGGLYLQFGAFSVSENAEQFLGHLKAQLGELADNLRIYSSGNLFRVRSGPYASDADANRIAEQVKLAIGMQPVPVR